MNTTHTAQMTDTETLRREAREATLRELPGYNPCLRGHPSHTYYLLGANGEVVAWAMGEKVPADFPLVGVAAALGGDRGSKVAGYVHPAGAENRVGVYRFYNAGVSIADAVKSWRREMRAAVATELKVSSDPEARFERLLRSYDWTAWASDDGRVWQGANRVWKRVCETAATLPADMTARVWDRVAPKDYARPMPALGAPVVPHPVA